MSLDWDTRNLDADLRAEFFPPDAEGKMHNHLHNALFATQAVGMGEVTITNYREFYVRQTLYCKGYSPLFNEMVAGSDEWTPIVLSIHECRALVGLRTNVTSISRTEFLKRLFKIVEDDATIEERRRAERKDETVA